MATEAGMGSRVQHVKGAREERAVLNAAMHKYQIQSLGGEKTEGEKPTDNAILTIIMLTTQRAHVDLI